MTDFRTLQCDDYWFVTMVDTKKKFCYDQYSHAFFRVAVVVIYIVWICQAPLNGNNNIHPAFFFVRSSFATFDSRFPKCLHKIFDQLVELVKNEAINQRRNEKKTHTEKSTFVHPCCRFPKSHREYYWYKFYAFMLLSNGDKMCVSIVSSSGWMRNI